MNRRALLATLSGSLVGIAGCASTGGPTSTPAGTETPTDKTVTSDQSPTETHTETEVAFGVELRQVEYVVNAYAPSSGRGIDPDDVVPEEEISVELREALSEARDGRFTTDSISDSLLVAIDEFRHPITGRLNPYVELDSQRYVFDPTVPTFVAELEAEILDDYDEDRLFREEERWDLESEEVQAFVRALTANGVEIPRSTYRRSAVPDAVTTFLNEYDYLEDQNGVSRIKTTERHTDPPYTITMRELTAEDMWGRPVVEEDALDDALVAFFERVLESEHRKPALPAGDRWQYFTDEVPDAYAAVADEFDSPPYYRLDGTVYSIVVGQPRYERIPVSVTVEDLDAASRRFTLTASPAPGKLDNEVEGPFTFTGQGALPSSLWIVHDGERFLLNANLDGRPDREELESIHTSEAISASYTVPDDLPAGTYVSRGQFAVSWNIPDQTPDEYGLFPFELLITIAAG